MRPILEYGCAVWDPHHKNDIESLEKIQKRAARFVTGNYDLHHGSTKFNMSKLQWKPLEERRACNKLNLLYKSKKGFIDLPPSQFLKENPRKPLNFAIPASSVDSHLYSFYPNTLRMWNSLADIGKTLSTPNSFNEYLKHTTVRTSY